jgi:hypothetical protein
VEVVAELRSSSKLRLAMHSPLIVRLLFSRKSMKIFGAEFNPGRGCEVNGINSALAVIHTSVPVYHITEAKMTVAC